MTNNKLYSTPSARGHKGARKPETLAETGRNPATNSLGDAIGEGVKEGSLDPDWVEWLMGWPIGWTRAEAIELLWLTWEIDPADGDSPASFMSPSTNDATGKAYTYDSGDKTRPRAALTAQARKGCNSGPIPRIGKGIKDRVNRLKAIGNGQVPQCVAKAWELLT